jgi:hypothetical protein
VALGLRTGDRAALRREFVGSAAATCRTPHLWLGVEYAVPMMPEVSADISLLPPSQPGPTKPLVSLDDHLGGADHVSSSPPPPPQPGAIVPAATNAPTPKLEIEPVLYVVDVPRGDDGDGRQISTPRCTGVAPTGGPLPDMDLWGGYRIDNDYIRKEGIPPCRPCTVFCCKYYFVIYVLCGACTWYLERRHLRSLETGKVEQAKRPGKAP